MEKLVLVRFGQAPSPVVSRALAPHIVGQAVAVPVPGAILSIFNTGSNLDQVCDDVKATGAFFILARFNDINLELPEELVQVIHQAIGTSTPTPRETQKVYTMDELLDLISKNGIESLTQDQRQQLENLE
jgi:hypothetical protein